MLSFCCKANWCISPKLSRYLTVRKTKTIQDVEDCKFPTSELLFSNFKMDSWKQMAITRDDENPSQKMMKWQLGEKTALCPFDNDVIKEIYRFENKEILRRTSVPSTNAIFTEKAFLFLPSKEHAECRKKLNPFFTLESMRYRFILVNDLIQKLLNTLYTKTIENGDEGVHLYTETKILAFEVAMRAIFGELLSEQESNAIYKEIEIILVGMMDINVENINNPKSDLGKAMISAKNFEKIISCIWAKGMNQYNEDKLDRHSTIYQMIDSGEIDEDIMRSIMLTIVVASYETTASSMCNIVYNMYKYPQQKEMLRRNIENIDLESFDDVMGNIYIESFVSESMRILPAVSVTSKVVLDDCIFNGIQMKKDMLISTPFMSMNYNQTVFDEPDKFDGLRFINNPPKRNEFLPFSMGAHKCLGRHLALLEMKCIVAALVTKCDIMYIDETRLELPQYFKYANVFGKFAPLSS